MTLLALPALATAATFGPYSESRWEVRALAGDPITITMPSFSSCPTYHEYVTGFSDPAPPDGQCRNVIAAFPAPRGARGNQHPCKLDWRTGRVLLDETSPGLEPFRPVSLGPVNLGSLPAGSWVELCAFSQGADGRWAARATAMFVTVGPFRLGKPTVRVERFAQNGRKGRVAVTCKHEAGTDDASVLVGTRTTYTIRVAGQTLTRVAGRPATMTFTSSAFKRGARVTASCSATSRLTAPGASREPRYVASSKPFFIWPRTTATLR